MKAPSLAEASAWPATATGAFELFTNPWDIALLAECFLGVCRFNEFQRRLGCSRKTLAKRLRSLVDDGVLRREQYQSRPDRYEYQLTDKGRDLIPVFMAMMRWGERWIAAVEPDGVFVDDALCQHPCAANTMCDRCGEEIRVQEVGVVARCESSAVTPRNRPVEVRDGPRRSGGVVADYDADAGRLPRSGQVSLSSSEMLRHVEGTVSQGEGMGFESP
jgi:DNA-binding HxlR family transcriptional regulator